MELRHLRYFVAVAEELHFGKAAARLFMAQPPLSQQIMQLEREIGAPLLMRNKRRVELTQAGRSFLADARDILMRVDEATERVKRISKGEAGWLGVGFVASATYSWLPEALRLFREHCPKVELVLLELLGEEQTAALWSRHIHVGFARLQGPEQGLVQEVIATEALVVALPATHRLTKETFVRLRDLAGEPLIIYPPKSTYTDFVMRLCRSAGFAPNVAQQTGEMQTAIGLVAAGIGTAIVPSAAQNLRRRGVVYLPLFDTDGVTPTIDLKMSYLADSEAPALPHFLAIARSTAAGDDVQVHRADL